MLTDRSRQPPTFIRQIRTAASARTPNEAGPQLFAEPKKTRPLPPRSAQSMIAPTRARRASLHPGNAATRCDIDRRSRTRPRFEHAQHRGAIGLVAPKNPTHLPVARGRPIPWNGRSRKRLELCLRRTLSLSEMLTKTQPALTPRRTLLLGSLALSASGLAAAKMSNSRRRRRPTPFRWFCHARSSSMRPSQIWSHRSRGAVAIRAALMSTQRYSGKLARIDRA